MQSPRTSALAKVALAGPSAIALGVYLPRLCPTIAAIGDSTELDNVALVHGVAHAPGFPLYVLFTEGFAGLPGFSPVVWLNASSAVLHAAAVLVTTVLVLALTRSLVAATTGGLVLALARSFVLGSLYTEVFPLNDLFFATLLLLAVRVGRASGPPSPGETRRTTRLFTAMAVVVGLASADQHIIVLSAPALAVLVWPALRENVRDKPTRLLLYVAAFGLPLALSYATLWRAAAHDPPVSAGDVHDFGALVHHFVRGDYWAYLHRRAPERPGHHSGLWGREALFGALLFDSLGPVASVAATVGLLVASLSSKGLGGATRREGVALALAAIASGPLFAAATTALFTMTTPAVAGIAERFVTMPLVAIAVLVGCAVAGLDRLVGSRLPTRAAWPLAALAGAVVVVPMVPHALEVDLRGDRRGEALAEDLVNETDDGSVIVVTGDLYDQAATYACTVQRTCGRRIFVTAGALSPGWQRTQLLRAHPDLSSAFEGTKGVATTRRFVEKVIGRGPVYVMPDFFLRDPSLRQFGIVPELLTARLLPSVEASAAALPGAYERAKRVADGTGCAGCASYLTKSYEPREELLLRTAYATALQNMAAAASALYHDTDLAQRLSAQAEAMQGAKPPLP